MTFLQAKALNKLVKATAPAQRAALFPGLAAQVLAAEHTSDAQHQFTLDIDTLQDDAQDMLQLSALFDAGDGGDNVNAPRDQDQTLLDDIMEACREIDMTDGDVNLLASRTSSLSLAPSTPPPVLYTTHTSIPLGTTIDDDEADLREDLDMALREHETSSLEDFIEDDEDTEYMPLDHDDDQPAERRNGTRRPRRRIRRLSSMDDD
jgi:hypothetical protein